MSTVIDNEFFARIGDTVIDGDDEECVRLILEGLENGMNPLEGVEKGLVPGIRQVGEDFGTGAIFLPELTMAAKVMKAGVAVLDERIKASGTKRLTYGKVVIGTVKGDIHDIGKSLVAALLQANGYDVIDLGVDVDNVITVRLQQCCHQRLLQMGKVIEKLEEVGMRDRLKVVVGGCPITQEFADEIRADAVGFDAQDAVVKVDRLLGITRPPVGTR